MDRGSCPHEPRRRLSCRTSRRAYNLNVVDCDATVTVARLSSIPVLKWGSGGYPQPPEANVKDNGFPWPPPGLLGTSRQKWEFRLCEHKI